MKFFGTTLGIMGYLVQVIGKKTETAVKLYKTADKYGNKNNLSLAAYGMQLLQKEKYQDALDQFKKIDTKNKKNYMDRIVATNKAIAYWKMDEINEAIEVLEELRSRYDYLNEEILTSLGYFYLESGDYEQALNITKQALEDEPEYAPALDNLGQIYYKQGDLEKAEEYFLEALEYKDMVDSKYYLGLIYEKRGDINKAREYFEKASNTKLSKFSTVSKEDLKSKNREYGNSSSYLSGHSAEPK